MGFLVGVGIGIGFAAIAGLRAFLPLGAMLSIVAFSGFGNPPFLFMQINNWLSLPLIGTLLALMVLECFLDKFAALDPLMDRAMVPVRSISGAAVLAMASVEWGLLDPMLGPMSSGHYVKLPSGLPLLAPYLIVGALIAGAVAVIKAVLRPCSAVRASARSRLLRSLAEDAAALVGVLVSLLAPMLVALLLFSCYWSERSRATQEGGLRTPGR